MTAWVKLDQRHIEEAERVAIARQASAVKNRRPAHNGAPDAASQALAIHVTGARCELAAKIYFDPVKWNALAGDGQSLKGLPDLDNFIDVKGRTKHWHSLIVQRDDADDWAYVLVFAAREDFFALTGWCWGHEAKQQSFWGDPAGGRAAYFIPADAKIMKPMSWLFDELRRRQQQ